MPPKKGDKIKSLKERVRARGFVQEGIQRTRLKRRPIDGVNERVPQPAPSPVDVPRSEETVTESMPKQHKRMSFRARLVIGSIIFFIGAMLLSILFLLFGSNTISGENIVINTDGPFAVAGGDSYPLQVTVANQNAIPVENATLIIEYPHGTQADDGSGKEIFRDRVSIERLAPGEIRNVAREVRVFGEENDEKTIRVSIEYRVEGSNATFVREADPLRFKISSSPVVLSLEHVERLTSGQEMTLELTLASNSEVPIENLLIEAAYPPGFEVLETDPDPAGGRNVWRFETLEPEEKKTIEIVGRLTGSTGDERVFRFTSGVPSNRDNLEVASVFSVTSGEVVLEGEFFDVDVSINGKDDTTVVVGSGDDVRVDVSFKNTLSDSVYDAEIILTLGGNALDDNEVDAGSGFFNSSQNTITWSASDISNFREVLPGQTRSVSFNIRQGAASSGATPQITLATELRGKRVAETRVPETLVGSETRTIRFEGSTAVASQVRYDLGPFTNTGPVPPVAEEVTTYTLELAVENGGNALSDARVSATLPSYMSWLNVVDAGDVVSFNSSAREVVWSIGDMGSGVSDSASFQVSFLPSVSQIGSVPVLLGEQQFRAQDRFTGTTVRSSSSAITARIFNSADIENSGRVESN